MPARTTTLTTHVLEAPLVERREVADDTFVFRFLVNGHPPPFLPGQACRVTLPDGQAKSCAIASSPTNGRTLMFAARVQGSPFGQALRDLPFGAAVRIGPATGGFTLPDDPTTPVVFVAVGLGITPFRSMLKWMADTGDRRPTALFYAAPTPQSMAFLDELEAWRPSLRLTLVPTLTGPDADGTPWRYGRGRIGADLIRNHVGPDGLARAAAYVSGPADVAQDLAKTLRSLGAKDGSLKVDAWGP